MKFTERLYKSSAGIWRQYYEHPFVMGMGDGSLSIERFKYFMIQDYLYLYEYAKVFALGVAKSRSPRIMRLFAQSVENTLNGEMNIHRAYMKRLGIDLDSAEKIEPALENTAYTSYMLSVAYCGDEAEITAAILACSWSYAEIGKRLNAIEGAKGHKLFGEWIEGYCSEEYQTANSGLIDLMDYLAEDLSEARKAELEMVFLRCSLFEKGFWDMAWNNGKDYAGI